MLGWPDKHTHTLLYEGSQKQISTADCYLGLFKSELFKIILFFPVGKITWSIGPGSNVPFFPKIRFHFVDLVVALKLPININNKGTCKLL